MTSNWFNHSPDPENDRPAGPLITRAFGATEAHAQITKPDTTEMDRLHTALIDDAFNAKVGMSEHEPELIKQIEAYRTSVGDYYAYYERQMLNDTDFAYTVCENVWKSIRYAFGKRLLPTKYTHLCGNHMGRYRLYIVLLTNLPIEQQLMNRWFFTEYDDYRKEIWKTHARLIVVEKHYRDTAMAVQQVGIGMGGMWLGLIGLAIGIIPALVWFCSWLFNA